MRATTPSKDTARLKTLGDLLGSRTIPSELHDDLPDGSARCHACAHACLVKPGRAGVCRVRFHDGEQFVAPGGYVAGIQCDPIEKKPFFHALPGASALSFGMLGCDLHCGYCQNWVTSQSLRDPSAGVAPRDVSPEQIVAVAMRMHAQVVTSTYNEPLITSEWATRVFRLAREAGLICSYVSNGNATERVLDYLQPYISLYKVDLKTFQDRQYRRLGGRLQPILDTIQSLVRRGIWVEIVTLVVPGFNDSDEELNDIAAFIASVSPDVPWHVTAFHHDYRMLDPSETTAGDLRRAREIGVSNGLRYVYAGNLPGEVADSEHTKCPGCGTILVARRGYRILEYHMDHGKCPRCSEIISGFWTDRVQPARTTAVPR
ncbi:AmmeMemoRadiSam system radical SAM enzyme [Candidatus Poribacteria bacterium]|nr:AmmeMemoRadiSam system radical SAM enzyme [Candidatus Poribacteria bacterium]